MKMIRFLLLAMLLATPLSADETYDLIFKQGTLSDLSETQVLEYDRAVIIAENPDYADRNTGKIRLNFEPDDMARLRFVQDEKYRNVGNFPATVGNPVIMYFVETVLRDVAQEAGGSPFYIRNRIKEALVTSAPIIDGVAAFGPDELETKEITLRPFENDKNRDRMGIYADLALTFTMSENAPGWYVSLAANAVGPDGTPGYSNALTLQPSGPAQ
ncbi:hypothetical protein [Yoonia sediminilitoris]|uniref:Uncharacterized protein n=1 Tax=Yoonia sediminilitoris TaxID=1286148 RepID=A0A2T6KSD2_9RHOB|nr:hypothetical protein [Yoonia sediminilitoris]PUB19435.1 hypothetical protein C8N45_1011033 [Yoonia sediminilitoris]RCW99603.1 hypothetical protein DFP92_1011033 [Yoonia sediminilitoris]